MKILIFLLFIAVVSSTQSPIPNGLINRCKGGKILKGSCKCLNNTGLIGSECKPCKGGIIKNNRCICLPGRRLVNDVCMMFKRETTSQSIIYPKKKPVIYLYPQETMDISVNLNIKKSIFTTIYPKFT